MKPEGTEWFFKPQLEFLITTSLCSTKEVSNEYTKLGAVNINKVFGMIL